MIVEKLIRQKWREFNFKNYSLSLLLTSSIVQWPGKLIVSQLVNMLTTFYDNKRHISLLTTTHLMILSCTTLTQSKSYFFNISFNIIVPKSHNSGFTAKFPIHFISPHSLFLFDRIILTIFCKSYKLGYYYNVYINRQDAQILPLNLCISLVYIHIAIWCMVHTTSNRILFVSQSSPPPQLLTINTKTKWSFKMSGALNPNKTVSHPRRLQS